MTSCMMILLTGLVMKRESFLNYFSAQDWPESVFLRVVDVGDSLQSRSFFFQDSVLTSYLVSYSGVHPGTYLMFLYPKPQEYPPPPSQSNLLDMLGNPETA